jgi:hypothetical protein
MFDDEIMESGCVAPRGGYRSLTEVVFGSPVMHRDRVEYHQNQTGLFIKLIIQLM